MGAGAEQTAGNEPAGNQAESTTAEQVAEIVADVLGVAEREPEPGPASDHLLNQHFQDLGGSSLQAIRICARVHKEIGVKAAPEDLFEADTVGDFCAALARAATGA